MKKYFISISALIILGIIYISLIVDKNDFESNFDSGGNYMGFNNLINLSNEYSLEESKKDGFYTFLDSKVYANENIWEEFMEKSSKGKDSFIRIAKFYSGDRRDTYFLDLYYHEGYYYIFDSSSDDLKKDGFLYLKKLKGKSGKPLKESKITILTNNSEITFDQLKEAMYSSSMKVIDKVRPYKIISLE